MDPLNPGNTPTVEDLQRYGLRWVRLVSRDDQVLRDYVGLMHWAGVAVCCTITEQSRGYVLPDCDVYQIGNEPDIAGHGDSFNAQQYVDYWNLYYGTWFAPGKPYAGNPVIGAGLGSGQTPYWRNVLNAGGLKGAAGFAVHPYAKTTAQAKTLLLQYQAITPALPIWVTEWSRPTAETAEFAAMLNRFPGVVAHARFSWGGQQDPQFNVTPQQLRLIGGTL